MNETRYFKIGLFSVTSIAVLITAILFFGMAKYLRPAHYMETYFNESVQGLEEGSAVKYRGITVGHVDKIKMISSVYTLHEIKNKKIFNQYIYVKMAINKESLEGFSHQASGENIMNLIKSGLRARLASQGLTGQSYLEITFLNPKDNPPVELAWIPNNLYIPSASSTFTRVTETVETVLPKLTKKITHSVDEFTQTSASYKKLADQLQKILKDSELHQTLLNLSDISTDLKKMSANGREAMQALTSTLNTTAQTMKGYRQKMDVILSNTTTLTENMKMFSNSAKQYPRQLLFGNPPPKLDPKA